mgnify:CR=1 FL=1
MNRAIVPATVARRFQTAGLWCWVLLAVGCGGLRNQATTLGSEVVAGVKATEPELFDIERRLADSMASFVGQAIDAAVLTKAKGTWDTMLARLNSESKVVVGRVAQGVERDLNRSIQVLVGENLELAENRLSGTTQRLVAQARRDADPLIDGLASSLERAMRDRLRPVLIEIITEASDSVARRVQALDRLVARSETGKQASRLMWGSLLGLGGVVAVGGLIWRRNSMRDRAAWDEIRKGLDPGQRGVLKEKLEQQGLEGQAKRLD